MGAYLEMLLEDVYEENCRFRFVACERVGFMVLFLEIMVILPAMYKMSDCNLANQTCLVVCGCAYLFLVRDGHCLQLSVSEISFIDMHRIESIW